MTVVLNFLSMFVLVFRFVCGLLLGLFAEFPLEDFLACSYCGKILLYKILPVRDNSLKFCFSLVCYEP